MSEVFGFDSRYWNGIFPEGYDYKFVGIKVSQGVNTGLDLSAPKKQWKRANRIYGLLRLPFHYWIGPKWYQDPHKWGRQQAQFMYDSLMEDYGGKYNGMGELPPALDVEDRSAPKGRRSIQSIKACLNKMEQLFGREPIVYSGGGYFDDWIKPYYSPDKFGDWDIYSYDLWEADPPPPTPIGEWEVGNIAIIQYQLDVSKDGFNANIDVNQTTQAWIDSVQEQQKVYTEDEVNQLLSEQEEELEAIWQGRISELEEACQGRVEEANREGWNDALAAVDVATDGLYKG